MEASKTKEHFPKCNVLLLQRKINSNSDLYNFFDEYNVFCSVCFIKAYTKGFNWIIDCPKKQTYSTKHHRERNKSEEEMFLTAFKILENILNEQPHNSTIRRN